MIIECGVMLNISVCMCLYTPACVMLPSGFMLNSRYVLSVMISAARLWVCHDTWRYLLWSVFSCCWLTDVSLLEHTQRPHKDIGPCTCVFVWWLRCLQLVRDILTFPLDTRLRHTLLNVGGVGEGKGPQVWLCFQHLCVTMVTFYT